MTDPAIPTETFQSRAELEAKLPGFMARAPKDQGQLDLIVTRPSHDERVLPSSLQVSAAEGVEGDHWITGSALPLPDGTADPDTQICIMMSGCIEAIAGPRDNWAPAGDNFFINMDLSPSNMSPGTRFAIGDAEFVVTEEPHNGCAKFAARYGHDACVFVNTGNGKELRLRGIYARVTKDGIVSVGDSVDKI